MRYFSLVLLLLLFGCEPTKVIVDPVITEEEVDSGIDGFFGVVNFSYMMVLAMRHGCQSLCIV